MRRTTTAAVLTFLLAVLSGCGAQRALEEAEARLAACEEERARLETSVARWESRFDREAARWQTMEASITEAVPNALAEFDAERERILELVPEQVQYEVAGFLDEYFATVMRGFDLMRQDSDDIKKELQITQRTLAAVGQDTRHISTAIDQAVAEERTNRQAALDHQQAVATEIGSLLDRVVAFDQGRINCKTCPDRIKLSRKEREAILGFHAQLVSALADLQTRAQSTPPPTDVPTSETATDEGTQP